MKDTVSIRCRIDNNTGIVFRPDVPLELPKSFRVFVDLSANSELSMMQNLPELAFSIVQKEKYAQIIYKHCEDEAMSIRTEEPGDWQDFLKKNFLHFIGLVIATLMAKEKEDFIWIEPIDNEKVWVLGIVYIGSLWEGMLAKCSKRDDLDDTFWLIGLEEPKAYREKSAFNLFGQLGDENGLPDTFPFLSSALPLGQEEHKRQLTIKVNPSQLWFLTFPIDYFCRLEYGLFSLYGDVEWVVTSDKSFLKNILERMQIQKELQNAENFLRYSVVVLNTYPGESGWKNNEKWIEGTELVIKFLKFLQDIEIRDERFFLRWYLNPTEDEICSELFSEDKTRYFFANFHTVDGRWQLGQGRRESWNKEPGVSQNSNDGFMDRMERWNLFHIRLMRLFHCHSILLPEATQVDPCVVPLLLSAGALRAEGSIHEENYLDYLCSLLYLLCNSRGLKPIVRGKCFEEALKHGGPSKFVSILREASDFLESCEWKSS